MISGNFLKRQPAHDRSLFFLCPPSGGLQFPHVAAAGTTRLGDANSRHWMSQGKGQDLLTGPGQLIPDFTKKKNGRQPLAEAGTVESFYTCKPKP